MRTSVGCLNESGEHWRIILRFPDDLSFLFTLTQVHWVHWVQNGAAFMRPQFVVSNSEVNALHYDESIKA